MFKKYNEYTWRCNEKIKTINSILCKQKLVTYTGRALIYGRRNNKKKRHDRSLNENDFVTILHKDLTVNEYDNLESTLQAEYSMIIDEMDKTIREKDLMHEQILRDLQHEEYA
jgi:hypothetical protein